MRLKDLISHPTWGRGVVGLSMVSLNFESLPGLHEARKHPADMLCLVNRHHRRNGLNPHLDLDRIPQIARMD